MPANRDRYIQVDKDLMDDPLLLCAAKKLATRNDLGLPQSLDDVTVLFLARARYVAALMRLWCYADTYIDEDDTIPMGHVEVDSYVGLPGFCEFSPREWLVCLTDDKVKLPGYCDKNDVVGRRKRRQAKAEAMRQKRKQARDSNVPSTFQARDSNVLPYPNTYTKKEKGPNGPSKKAPIDDRKWLTRLKEAELTPGLNVAALRRFIDYRRERRPAVTTAGVIALAERLAGFGDHAAQMDSVKTAIANEWQGIQPPDRPRATTAHAYATRPTQESALAAIDAASRLTTQDQGDIHTHDDGYVRLSE